MANVNAINQECADLTYLSAPSTSKERCEYNFSNYIHDYTLGIIRRNLEYIYESKG